MSAEITERSTWYAYQAIPMAILTVEGVICSLVVRDGIWLLMKTLIDGVGRAVAKRAHAELCIILNESTSYLSKQFNSQHCDTM